MDREKLRELAAEIAQGSASPAEQAEFSGLLAGADPDLKQEIGQIFDVGALLSIGLAKAPPAGLKEKVLSGARNNDLKFVHGLADDGWQALPVPGAFMKVLSKNPELGHVVVLGKLEAGTRYPAHRHATAEQFILLSGDLVIGDKQLKAGDFHEAAAGSEHGENYSETGCVLLAILSPKDLRLQLASMS